MQEVLVRTCKSLCTWFPTKVAPWKAWHFTLRCLSSCLNTERRDHHKVKMFPSMCFLKLSSQQTIAKERLWWQFGVGVYVHYHLVSYSASSCCLTPHTCTSSLLSGSGKLSVRNVFSCSNTVTCSFWDCSWDLRDECCWRAAGYCWKVLPPVSLPRSASANLKSSCLQASFSKFQRRLKMPKERCKPGIHT